MAMQTNTYGPRPIPATVTVTVSPDLLSASLIIEPPRYQGADVTPQMIDDALKAAKVTFGIDVMLLEKIKKQPQYKHEYQIARGIPPTPGKNGSIRYCFEIKSKSQPKLREDGTVDYRDLGIVVNVKGGQLLAEITPPTSGKEGMTVTGKKIPPTPGKPVPSPVGRNTSLSPDETKLYSTIDGHVKMEGSRINVIDTFIVSESVGTSTGNIRSVANVSVMESVLEGFLVEAAGNVEIGRSVEGGFVKAGGNIVIHGGVVGMSRSKIECGGNLSSTFFENCEVTAGGSIRAESIMNSNVKCGGKLELYGLRAKMMGGRFVVGGDVVANEIGSPSNLFTEIVLGADPSIMTRYSALKVEKKQLAEQIDKLKKIVELLLKYQQAGQLPPSKKRMLESSQVSLEATINKLDAADKEYDMLSAQIENSGKGRVICHGTMYRGVKLTIGFASMKVETDITSSVFSLADDKIVVTPLTY